MIFVVGHEFPKSDVDSVFSSILFANYYDQISVSKVKPIRLNKKVKKISNILQKLDVNYPKKYIVKPEDSFILVDHSDIDQSLNYFKLKNNIVGIVDHHYYSKSYPNLEFNTNNKYGSTATIIYYMYKKEKIKITKKLALLFVYAIISDTKNLLLETTTKKDIVAIEELYSNFKLKSRELIFKDLYSFKDLNKLSSSKLLDKSYKIYNYKDYNIRISNINCNSKFLKEEQVIKYLGKNINSKYSNFDLFILSFKNIDTLKTNVYYFGKFSFYFRNWNYNILKTRKKLFLKIKNKLDSIN